MKSVRNVAIIALTLVILASMILAAIFVPKDLDKQSEAHFQVDCTPKEAETETEYETFETERPKSVCLIDRSGSMDDYANKLFFAAGYDIIQTFGTEDSKITTEVVNALDKGYQRIGIVTDLESWPYEEIETISGRSFGNCEIVFFIPDDVDQNCYYDYVQRYRDALDATNSTFRFVYLDSQKVVSVFENYRQLVTVPTTTTITSGDSGFSVTGDYVEGNKIPYSLVLILIMVFFIIIMALIIALIALAGVFGKEKQTTGTGTVPTGVVRSLKADAVALDGSSSVNHIYNQFITWCRAEQVPSVFRFADTVEKLSLDKAENKTAGGQTAGYECMKRLYDEGYKVITIVSDMQFNDTLTDQNIMFDKIFFVGSNLKESNVSHLIGFCKDYEVISI